MCPCCVRCQTSGWRKGYVVQDLECLQIVHNRLHLVDEPVVAPENDADGVFCRSNTVILHCDHSLSS